MNSSRFLTPRPIAANSVGNLLETKHWLDGLLPSTPPPTDPSRIQFVRAVYDALNRDTESTRSALSTGPSLPPTTVTRLTAYTSTGLKWQTTDELGRQTQANFDGAGRALKTISPLVDDGTGTMTNAITQMAYDGNNNVIQKTNPLGRIWRFESDTRNRKTAELQPGPTGAPPGPTIHHDYDPVGNAVALTDAMGNTMNTTFDQANRAIQVQAPPVLGPDGVMARPTTTTAYDRNSNVVSVTDPNLHTTLNTYDAINRLTSTTDAEGITVAYAYDLDDNRISATDGKLQTTQFAYDGLKRNTGVTDPAGKTTVLAYDAINKISRTDPIGQVTLYTADLRNLPLAVVYPGRTQDNRAYVHDDVGNLLTVSVAGYSGAADEAYTYDALNRVSSETSGGLTHQYKHDLAGNRISVQYGGTGRTLLSTYDELNRLSTLTDADRTTTYGYDLNSNVLTKALPGATISTTYDALNRKLVISSTTYSYAHLYDLASNLVQIQENLYGTLSRVVSNIYDKINRLKNETLSTFPLSPGTVGPAPYSPDPSTITSTTDYAYDAANNRTQKVKDGVTTNYTYPNALNQLTGWSDGTITVGFTYDLNGNRSTRTQGGVTDTYAYDHDNRLVATTKGGTTFAYTYDHRTRRVGRVEGSTATQIIFSGGTSVAEFMGATLTVEYIRGSDWGGGVGGLLYSIRSDVAYFTHYNARGPPRHRSDQAQILQRAFTSAVVPKWGWYAGPGWGRETAGYLGIKPLNSPSDKAAYVHDDAYWQIRNNVNLTKSQKTDYIHHADWTLRQSAARGEAGPAENIYRSALDKLFEIKSKNPPGGIKAYIPRAIPAYHDNSHLPDAYRQ